MRLVSYNILDGGEGRADPIAEVLIAQRADIIAVVEADNHDVLHRLSYRLGMDYVVGEGAQHSAAIFSKWPIRDTVNLAAVNRAGPRSLLLAHVAVPGGGETLPVAVVHLHPRADDADEEIRLKQLETVLEMLAEYRSARRPHVLMGDFNSNSPLQQIDPAMCKHSTQCSWTRNGNSLPRKVVTRLLDFGYIDSLAVADMRAAQTSGSFTTQDSGQRVDYIFVHGVENSRIAAAWIEQDRLAKYASDHFPVGCEIK